MYSFVDFPGKGSRLSDSPHSMNSICFYSLNYTSVYIIYMCMHPHIYIYMDININICYIYIYLHIQFFNINIYIYMYILA